jgi:hypothetical protein
VGVDVVDYGYLVYSGSYDKSFEGFNYVLDVLNF